MKITLGQLKKVIHSQLAEAKSAKHGEVKKINEGKKRYYIQDNIGRAKYTVNFHNGTSTHDDGSDFFDIRIFHNKRERDAFVKQLNSSGYHERGVMEDGFKSKGEVKKINEATFTKLIKKLIVEETKVLKSVKLNEGTGNFYNKNATHIFAFGMNTEDNEDDGEYNSDQHQIDYEDQISYIIEELSKIPGFIEGEYDFDDNRNFSGRSLGAVSVNISNKNDTSVQIICIARSGYYEGANLDWELKFTGPDGYDIDSPDDIPQRSYATKLQRAADALVKKVEKVYARCTTPYGVSARFSNGETIYHKIDGKKSK